METMIEAVEEPYVEMDGRVLACPIHADTCIAGWGLSDAEGTYEVRPWTPDEIAAYERQAKRARRWQWVPFSVGRWLRLPHAPANQRVHVARNVGTMTLHGRFEGIAIMGHMHK